MTFNILHIINEDKKNKLKQSITRSNNRDSLLKTIYGTNETINGISATDTTIVQDQKHMAEEYHLQNLLPENWFLTKNQYSIWKETHKKEIGGSLEAFLEYWVKHYWNDKGIIWHIDDKGNKYPYDKEKLTWLLQNIFQVYMNHNGCFIQINRNNRRRIVSNLGHNIFSYYVGSMYDYKDKTNFNIKVPIFQKVFNASLWRGKYETYINFPDEMWQRRLTCIDDENEFIKYEIGYDKKGYDYEIHKRRYKRVEDDSVYQQSDIGLVVKRLIDSSHNTMGFLTNKQIIENITIVIPSYKLVSVKENESGEVEKCLIGDKALSIMCRRNFIWYAEKYGYECDEKAREGGIKGIRVQKIKHLSTTI